MSSCWKWNSIQVGQQGQQLLFQPIFIACISPGSPNTQFHSISQRYTRAIMCRTLYTNAIIVFIIETLSLETFRLLWHDFSRLFAEEKRISSDWIANGLDI